jgi:hypothetical protein
MDSSAIMRDVSDDEQKIPNDKIKPSSMGSEPGTIKSWGDDFSQSLKKFLNSDQQKEKGPQQMKDFSERDVSQFFEPTEGLWTHFMRVQNLGTVYYDDRGNLELYAVGSDNLGKLQNWITSHSGMNKITALINAENNVVLNQFAKRRQCMYDLNITPTPQVLTTLVNIPDLQTCDNFQQTLTDNDIYNDVRVEKFNPAIFNFDEFDNWRPDIETPVWMAWAKDGTSLYYKDSEDNLEIYHTDSSGHPNQHALYVKIPQFLYQEHNKLSVARSRLYQQTNELHATQEQLNDMVKRIEKHKLSTPFYSALKKWGDGLYQTTQSQAKGAWTYKPAQGKTPAKPKFYFNPRPLRKGMSTIGLLNDTFETLKFGSS